jgi:hypothetical protein
MIHSAPGPRGRLPRKPSLRTAAALTASLALIGGAAAIAPRLTAHTATQHIQRVDSATTTYNGTVSNNGSGANVYPYSGSTTSLSDNPNVAIGKLPDGAQVHVQCYLTATPVTGPNGTGSGNSDPYWDQIDAASSSMPTVSSGNTAVVPDAYISTTPQVNQLVPACGTAPSTTTNGSSPSPTPTTPGLAASSGTASSGTASSGTASSGKACVFYAPSGANGLGHVGWAFLDPAQNEWHYGSMENTSGSGFNNDIYNGQWSSSGSSFDSAAQAFAGELWENVPAGLKTKGIPPGDIRQTPNGMMIKAHNAGYYTAYRCRQTSTTDVATTLKLIDGWSITGYNLATDNCNTRTQEILATYSLDAFPDPAEYQWIPALSWTVPATFFTVVLTAGGYDPPTGLTVSTARGHHYLRLR